MLTHSRVHSFTPRAAGRGARHPLDCMCMGHTHSVVVALVLLSGDYGGPMFLMPGMVIALYTTGMLDKVG